MGWEKGICAGCAREGGGEGAGEDGSIVLWSQGDGTGGEKDFDGGGRAGRPFVYEFLDEGQVERGFVASGIRFVLCNFVTVLTTPN